MVTIAVLWLNIKKEKALQAILNKFPFKDIINFIYKMKIQNIFFPNE